MNWEYLILTVKSGMLDSDDPFSMQQDGVSVGKENLAAALNDLGSKGWEAFSSNATRPGVIDTILLKKQKSS